MAEYIAYHPEVKIEPNMKEGHRVIAAERNRARATPCAEDNTINSEQAVAYQGNHKRAASETTSGGKGITTRPDSF